MIDLEEHRRALFGIAYRMLGDRAEAEDVVQDAFIKVHDADAEVVASPRAWLSTVVMRLCLDRLKSARVRREQYVGPWLPEPLPTEAAVSVRPSGRGVIGSQTWVAGSKAFTSEPVVVAQIRPSAPATAEQ